MDITFISKTKYQSNEIQSSIKIIADSLIISTQNTIIASKVEFWQIIQNKILGIKEPCDWLKELLTSDYVNVSDNKITSVEQVFDSNRCRYSIIQKSYENFIGLILLTSSFESFRDICMTHYKKSS